MWLKNGWPSIRSSSDRDVPAIEIVFQICAYKAMTNSMKKALLILPLILAGSMPTYAQSNDSLVVFWLSGPRHQLGVSINMDTWNLKRLDKNGDGKADVVMTRRDDQDNLLGILVIDGHTNEQLWHVQDVPQELGWTDATGHYDLLGFGDPDSDGDIEAIFASEDEDIRVINTEDNSLEWSWAQSSAGKQSDMPRLRGIMDLNNDGSEEFIVVTQNPRTVQVWGAAMRATSTERDDEVPQRAELQQNYPNPFLSFTTIAYTIEQAGPVSVTIYDILGREVRTLLTNVELPPGSYTLPWDGSDASGTPVAAGTYFYQLRVGDYVSSKQAVRVR